MSTQEKRDPTPEQKTPAKIRVQWQSCGTCDGEHGMYGDVEMDTLNNWGIYRYSCVYPRGRDGKGKREFESYVWIKGYDKKITTGTEFYAALRQLGYIPPKQPEENQIEENNRRQPN